MHNRSTTPQLIQMTALPFSLPFFFKFNFPRNSRIFFQACISKRIACVPLLLGSLIRDRKQWKRRMVPPKKIQVPVSPNILIKLKVPIQDKAAKKDEADPFEFAMKVIISHCRGIYECCLSIHYFKEVWLIQRKSTAQKLLDHGLDQDRNRLSATASTFIELTRRWAKMIQQSLRVAHGICIFCTLVHTTENCHLYKNEEERTLRLKDLGLCPRCLGISHSSRNCGSACSACGRRHQEILCDKYRELYRNCDRSILNRQLMDQLLKNAHFQKTFLDICWGDRDRLPYPYNNHLVRPDKRNQISQTVSTG